MGLFKKGAGGEGNRKKTQRRAGATQKVKNRKTKGTSTGKVPKQRDN